MKMRLHPKNWSACGWSSGFSLRRKHKMNREHQRGFLMADLVVATAILSMAVLPLGYSFAHEQRVLKNEYYRCVANEIVDGEMEILAAGVAKNLPDGLHIYAVHANAAAKLPPSHFQLTKTGDHLRLEWSADKKSGVGPVVRETTLQ